LLCACLALLAVSSFVAPAAGALSGYAAMQYGTVYALDMVCPEAGQVIATYALVANAANGQEFTYSYGATLPLPADSSPQTTLSRVVPNVALSEYHFRITCQTAGGCNVNWDIVYYCKASSGTSHRQKEASAGPHLPRC